MAQDETSTAQSSEGSGASCARFRVSFGALVALPSRTSHKMLCMAGHKTPHMLYAAQSSL